MKAELALAGAAGLLIILMSILGARGAATWTTSDGTEINQHDCKCNNNVTGHFCGGSKYLIYNNNTGCRKGFVFYCTKEMLYPQDVGECSKGTSCDPKDEEGKDECAAGAPGPKDCACKNDAVGNFCRRYPPYVLQDDEDYGCRDETVYKCTKGQKYATVAEECVKPKECISEKRGKGYCGKEPQPDECKCNNDKEGWYCGGGKYLKSKPGTRGCRRNFRFRCATFGKDNGFVPYEIRKCNPGYHCASSAKNPEKAKCYKDKKKN